MGLRKKFLNQVKATFGRASSRVERPLESDVSPDLSITSGQPPGVGTHTSRSDSPRDGNGRGIQTTKARSTGSRDNNVAPNTENTVVVNRLGALDLKRQQAMDKQYPNDQRDIDNVEQIRNIRGTSPSTSDSCNRSAVANNEADLFSSGRPPLSHSAYRSTELDGVKNSGISFGEGTVNVSNVNTGNTTTVTGTLIQNNTPNERIRPGLEILERRFAASAYHNSFQRIDPPRCHPDTRVAIQKQIYDWILMDFVIRKAWIMWMHGAAGAGKSAIMQSVAELCEKAQIPLASFFFVRTDDTRNSMASFIATLVYQLIQTIPQTQGEIFGIIESNPRIFDQSLESQLQKLFLQPILRMQQHFKGFFVVFIDGLDECIERARQSELIKLFGTVSHSRIPVIFLLASRREPQIEAEFVRETFCKILEILPLDNSDVEKTSEDIRRFVVDKFRDIKQTHLLKRHLPLDWPATSMVDEIVDKSSGQFIFASVVINYISSPRANPSIQLDIIRGIRLRDPSSQNPFAHLDALYQHIFSQIEAHNKVFDIIALRLLTSFTHIFSFETVLLLEAGELDVLFADLTAVILCEPHTKDDAKLKFLHASLPDFLLDKSRSEQYYIDPNEYRTKLSCMLLERPPPISDPLWSTDELTHVMDQEGIRLEVILDLVKEVKASEQLRAAFMKFNFTFYNDTFVMEGWYLVRDIIQHLKTLDFEDQDEAYRHVVDMLAVEYAKYWPSFINEVQAEVKQQSPDLTNRIDEILHLT